MGRKTVEVRIEGDGRDAGKLFVITEMPAMQSERWATKALKAAGKARAEFDKDELRQGGLAALAIITARAFSYIPDDEMFPLFDELMGCVQIKPDPANPLVIRKLFDGDIEEVPTIWRLREAAVELHLGFFPAAVQFLGLVKAALTSLTSRPSAAPISPAASPS